MIARKLRNPVGDNKGAAIIELAFIAPILALTAIGVVDMSNAFSRKLALEQGAQRAIEKIMQTTGETSVQATLKTEAVCQVNGVGTDGNCKTAPITTSNVTVTYRLECTVAGVGAATFQTSTDSIVFDAFICPTGTQASRYIQIAITDKYTPLFPVHFGSFDNSDGTYHISATAGMRTQ